MFFLSGSYTLPLVERCYSGSVSEYLGRIQHASTAEPVHVGILAFLEELTGPHMFICIYACVCVCVFAQVNVLRVESPINYPCLSISATLNPDNPEP